MDRATYDEYVCRFNAKDPSAFDQFLIANVEVQNGRLQFRGVDAIKAHYAKIWRSMSEELHVKRFVSDGFTGAVQLHTHFEVLRDDPESPFGRASAGETFDYYGVVMYAFLSGRIVRIIVSYLDYTKTNCEGVASSLGIVH